MSKAIAIYMRLSMADGDLDDDEKIESNSIENQRSLLLSYIEKDDDLAFSDVREYVDDGYTGTNFDRPGFQRMIQDAQAGEIGCILVKDLSRLGRNYIGSGDYIDQVFPMLGVRFIAVNNGFDSSENAGNTMGVDLAVTNLINTMYSRDISRKVKSSFQVKWKQGCATSCHVPFGYLWDPESEPRWVKDPVASQYVRKIFDMALDGFTTGQIARAMNEAHIPTPETYARSIGKKLGKTSFVPECEKAWESQNVHSILKRYEYTGALVMRKMENISFGCKKKKKVEEEDQVITENAHEAIVTHEEFEEAQSAIKTAKPHLNRTEFKYPLKGVVRCGNCHCRLAYRKLDGEMCFFCRHKMAAGKYSDCYEGRYRESAVNTCVAEAISQVIQMAGFLGEQLQEGEDRRTIEIKIEDTEDKLRSKIEILKAERIRQYEEYAGNVISRDVYMAKKKQITDQIETLQAEIQEIRDQDQKKEEVMGGLQEISQQKQTMEGPLTEEAVQAFVDTVYLSDGDKVQVVFKCEDLLQKALDQYISDFKEDDRAESETG